MIYIIYIRIGIYIHTYRNTHTHTHISHICNEGDRTGNVSDMAVPTSTCRISQQQECSGTSRAVSRSSGSCQQIKHKEVKMEKQIESPQLMTS